MRPIKFRGQTRKKGEKRWMDGTPMDGNWVYGGIYPGDYDFSIVKVVNSSGKMVVYSDTVGQYTGLHDIDDIEIYEDDIVYYEGSFYRVVFESRYGCGYFGISISDDEVLIFGIFVDSSKTKVVGNIHDNPELLGEYLCEATERSEK